MHGFKHHALFVLDASVLNRSTTSGSCGDKKAFAP